MWCVADLNNDSIAKMEDVLEVYEKPYDREQPVVCLGREAGYATRRCPPALSGRTGPRSQGGTTNMSVVAPPMSSVRSSQKRDVISPSLRRIDPASEFAQVAVTLALQYPEAKTIHLVMDNLNIHHRKWLSDVFGAEMAAQVWDRFTVHYTPTHGSWLNQAEIEIGLFCRQCLGTRRIPDLQTLRREARAWNRWMNRDRVKINWKFNRKTARRKFGYKRQSFKRSQT
jgi:hypothetical protein